MQTECNVKVVEYLPTFYFGSLLLLFGVEITLDWLVRSWAKVTKKEYLLLWATFIAVMLGPAPAQHNTMLAPRHAFTADLQHVADVADCSPSFAVLACLQSCRCAESPQTVVQLLYESAHVCLMWCVICAASS